MVIKMGLFDMRCCSNPECEVGSVVPKECERCPKCGSEVKKLRFSEARKLYQQKMKNVGVKKLKIVVEKFVDEFTCLNCNHTWIEAPASIAEKLSKAGEEMTKLGNALMMPWTIPMWRKEQKARCPKCGSTVLKKEKKKLFVLE